MDTNVILRVENLTTQFGKAEKAVTAVNNVSFSVEKGKTLGIVGESGCGKSVTSLSIMRLIGFSGGNITEGKIDFDGRDLLSLSEKEMRSVRGNDVAMIFQEPMTALNPVFTIGFQLCEVIRLHMNLDAKQARERAVELLNKVHIPRADKIIDEYPHQLSGGMRQRVMIAMAIACEPKLLIADEPTTALDVTIQARILELIETIKKERSLSIIFITHDLGVVANITDRVYVMYAGKVVESGTAEEIFFEPAHPYTWALLSSVPDMESKEKLLSIPGTPPNMIYPPKGDAFAPRNEYAMAIDFEQEPPFFKLSDTHYAATWLLHPDAPKTPMPEVLAQRIARMKEAGQ